LIFTAFFLALALNAPVHWLASHMPGRLRGSRTVGTTVSFLIVVVLLGFFIASMVPPIVRQTESFIDGAPQLLHSLRDSNSDLGQLVSRYHLEGRLDELSQDLTSRLQTVGSKAFTTLGSVGSSAFATLTVLALTFMMLIEGPRWVSFVQGLIAYKYRATAGRLARDMYRVIKGYVNGQVILAVVAACLLLPALLVLHISYPIALMFVVFICGLIPMVGHTIGAAIVTLVALFHSPTSAALVLLYYVLYQQIENYAIQPRIQANSTDMSPLLVFMAVVVGVNFNGLLGGLVAIPLAGCLRILVLEYIRARGLGTAKAPPAVRSEIQAATANADETK
jgi:predicted PurR-regulated permease PerM